jgi:hypothetical protein
MPGLGVCRLGDGVSVGGKCVSVRIWLLRLVKAVDVSIDGWLVIELANNLKSFSQKEPPLPDANKLPLLLLDIMLAAEVMILLLLLIPVRPARSC